MSVCSPDPWQVKNKTIEQENTETEEIKSFEDNFTPQDNNNSSNSDEQDTQDKGECNERKPHEPLPDSANYLQLLERKLAKVQKGSKLLESLQEKREDCMRTLLEGDSPVQTIEQLLELETPIESGRLHRHLIPEQALTVGETVNIVEHDALEETPTDS